MVRPRWLHAPKWRNHLPLRPLGHSWDLFVAIWASLNLLLVVFDISYVPLRNFWLQRQLYLFPGVAIAIPLTFLPDITPYYDPIKGIEPHRDTENYLRRWHDLDQHLLSNKLTANKSKQLLGQQLALTDQLITENPFLACCPVDTSGKQA